MKALFRVFQIPAYNKRIFAISHITPARISWLRTTDPSVVIILLDEPKKVSEAKAYAQAALTIHRERHEFLHRIHAAIVIARSRTISKRLTNKKLLEDLLTELDNAAQRYDSLLADLKANFRKDLCV